MKSLLRKLPAVLAVMMLLGPALRAAGQAEASKEYAIKAAFIYHFIEFTEWPEQSLPATDQPMVIGVVGESPIREALELAVKDKKTHGRRVAVKQFGAGAEVAGCQVLFVGGMPHERLKAILDKIKGQSVLTVGEGGDFTEAGGIIRFFMEDKKTRFEIRLKAMEAARLKISSKLLKLAKISGE